MIIFKPETAYADNPCKSLNVEGTLEVTYENTALLRRLANPRSTSMDHFLPIMRVPRELLPWKNKRETLNAMVYQGTAFLFDPTSVSGMHLINNDGYGGYTIMEDSDRELRRHFQAVRYAKGRVLKTGLGFGCFVRACLAKPEVEHIDVIEIDPEIAEHFGRPFTNEPRVTVHVADALTWTIPPDSRWDLAWHDIYCDGNDGLTKLHTELMKKFKNHATLQGAWDLPNWAKRMANSRRRLLI